MSMQKGRFAVGIFAGLIFALAIVGSSNLFSNSPTSFSTGSGVGSGQQPAFSQTTSSTSTSTSTVHSSSSSIGVTMPPTGNSVDASGKSTTTTTIVTTATGSSSTTLESVQAPSVAFAAQSSPSNFHNILSQPAQSLVIIVPLIAAIFFGLLFYRTTTVRE